MTNNNDMPDDVRISRGDLERIESALMRARAHIEDWSIDAQCDKALSILSTALAKGVGG